MIYYRVFCSTCKSDVTSGMIAEEDDAKYFGDKHLISNPRHCLILYKCSESGPEVSEGGQQSLPFLNLELISFIKPDNTWYKKEESK